MMHYLKQIKRISDVLPVLMVALTKQDRYLPELDFNWRGNVVHSLLMCYYALFWRRWGIRHGGLSWQVDSTGKRKVWVHTWFGALLFLEHEVIRPIFRWKFVPVYIEIPQLAFASPMQQQSPQRMPFLFAIAFDQGWAASGTSSSPAIASVAPAGSDRLLTTHLNYGAASITTVPTFGGSASTIIAIQVDTGDGTPRLSSYRLVNPSTSSGSITASLSGSSFWIFIGTSYTGIDQTTPTAAESQNGSPWTDGTPKTYSATSNLNGSWFWISAKQDSAGTSFSIDAPGQLRKGEDASPINMMGDGATAVNSGNSGSATVNWTGGGQRIGVQYCMLRPVVASGPANLKTYNTNAVANIKSIDTNLIANVKSLNTNT